MSEASARQLDGGPARQSEDTEIASGTFPAPSVLAESFLEENLRHLALPALTLEAVRAATGTGNLTGLDLGVPVLSRAGALLGQTPSDEELQHAASHEQTLIVVFGLGLGETARALRSLTNEPIIVFEPDPAILRRVLELGPTDLSDFNIVCTTHDLTQIWPSLFGARRSALVLNTPGYADAFPDAAADLRTEVAELVQRCRVNHETHRLRARDWVADVLANVELLGEHPGFLALTGKYRGVPAFVVGAGPSLGKNGRHLLQAQKKGIVFALNSSARALDRLGVEPQVVACMESIDVSHLLKEVSYLDRAIRAFSLSAHPNTLRTGKGPLLAVWEGISQLSLPLFQLTGHTGLAVNGSVSTLMFALAQRLGCSPIVFVGQDLAYTDGRAYAPGTPYENSRVARNSDGRSIDMQWCDTLRATHRLEGKSMHEREPLNETVAWGGQGHVLSSVGFSAVRGWLESAAVVLSREAPETRLVNATEGGSRIAGFEEIRLEDLLADLPERNISAESIVAAAHAESAPLTRRQIADWAEAQAELAAKARHSARRIRRLADASLSAARRGDASVSARLQRLDAAELELRKRVADAPLLDAWSWADVDRLMETQAEHSSDSHESAYAALAFEARFGSQIDACARKLEQELRNLSKRLRHE
ncbi:MAG: motility associated factor glycosyltransferase family protein [Myxococcota bacterium]